MASSDPFERAVYDHPHDESLWLVYADWLEERGDARGELVRVQRALCRMPAQDERLPALQERKRKLFAAHQQEWAPYLEPLAGKARVESYRGLLDHVHIEN